MQHKELLEAISLVAEEYVKNAPYNHIMEGIVMDANNVSGLYSVEINNVIYQNIRCAIDETKLAVGNVVYVVIVNNDFSHKLILGKSGYQEIVETLDYENLPTTPVRIYRLDNNPTGKAYRFEYAFEGYPPEYKWEQLLHRRNDGKVYMISHIYSDETVIMFYLKRNSADRVEYYGKNRLWGGE